MRPILIAILMLFPWQAFSAEINVNLKMQGNKYRAVITSDNPQHEERIYLFNKREELSGFLESVPNIVDSSFEGIITPAN